MISILQAKKNTERFLIRIPEVCGVGISKDRRKIIIYTCSIPTVQLPDNIYGYPTEIKRITTFKPLFTDCYPTCDLKRISRIRPVTGGIGASHYLSNAGTIGCLVKDANTHTPLLISNNHVFANISTDFNPTCARGDPITSPAISDGGYESDVIGYLERWVTLKEHDNNIADCAVISPSEAVMPGILSTHGIVQVKSIKTLDGHARVKKYGRTTGFTTGRVIDLDFSTEIEYLNGVKAHYVDQILVEMNIQGGDSGSILLDHNNNAVGLIFAGSGELTGKLYGIANKISSVFALLDVEPWS